MKVFHWILNVILIAPIIIWLVISVTQAKSERNLFEQKLKKEAVAHKAGTY